MDQRLTLGMTNMDIFSPRYCICVQVITQLQTEMAVELLVDRPSIVLESLHMEEIDPDCYWEVDILPLESARKISSGQVNSGTYDDMFAVDGNIYYLELLWDDDITNLKAFSSWYAILEEQTYVNLLWLDGDEDRYRRDY